LFGYNEEERPGPSHQGTTAGKYAHRLGKGLSGAGCHHAGECPTREWRQILVRAGGQYEVLGIDEV
jgi:hypothetical protein